MHDAPHLQTMTSAELRDYREELREVNNHEPTQWSIDRADAIDAILRERELPRKSNPALDALRRNVSGKVASGEAESIVEIPAP